MKKLKASLPWLVIGVLCFPLSLFLVHSILNWTVAQNHNVEEHRVFVTYTKRNGGGGLYGSPSYFVKFTTEDGSKHAVRWTTSDAGSARAGQHWRAYSYTKGEDTNVRWWPNDPRVLKPGLANAVGVLVGMALTPTVMFWIRK